MSQDMTFCSDKKCKLKKCELNPCHINWAVGMPYRSFADFANTKYCLKNEQRSNNNEIRKKD